MNRLWYFEYAQIIQNDSLLRVVPGQSETFTRIVTINEPFYRSYFEGRSPLRPEKLKAAICALLSARPRLLIIDIDTSDSDFRVLEGLSRFKSLIWARGAISKKRQELLENERIYDTPDLTGHDTVLIPSPILGGTSTSVQSGLALVPLAHDLTVREFARVYQVGSRQEPSLHWAAVQASGLKTDTGDRTALQVLSYNRHHSFQPLPLNRVMESVRAEDGSRACEETIHHPSDRSLETTFPALQDKIVLLGGNYDRCDTAFISTCPANRQTAGWFLNAQDRTR